MCSVDPRGSLRLGGLRLGKAAEHLHGLGRKAVVWDDAMESGGHLPDDAVARSDQTRPDQARMAAWSDRACWRYGVDHGLYTVCNVLHEATQQNLLPHCHSWHSFFCDQVVMIWRSWEGLEKLGNRAFAQGHSVVLAPQAYTYLDQWQDRTHSQLRFASALDHPEVMDA